MSDVHNMSEAKEGRKRPQILWLQIFQLHLDFLVFSSSRATQSEDKLPVNAKASKPGI